MLGQNEISSPFRSENTLVVNSVWSTIQGEGPDAGRPAIFVRLARCSLACIWCDTEFETGDVYKQTDLIEEVVALAKRTNCSLVIVTGGEPMLQNFLPFVAGCNSHGLSVGVETAGTHYLEGLEHFFWGGRRRFRGNIIVCSPKTPKIADKLIPLVGAWKYIIVAGELDDEGLPNRSTQIKDKIQTLFRPPPGHPAPMYVQPCDLGDPELNKANLIAAVQSAKMSYGRRLGLQLHKIANLP